MQWQRYGYAGVVTGTLCGHKDLQMLPLAEWGIKFSGEGVWGGKCLKEIPHKRTELHKELHSYQNFFRNTTTDAGCIVSLMGTFPILADPNKTKYSDVDYSKIFSACLYLIQDQLNQPTFGRYNNSHSFTLVFLSQGQLGGKDYPNNINWEDVLREYFGFQRLTSDFTNHTGYGTNSRICILGLCRSRYRLDSYGVPNPIIPKA